jgi:hypothetical protein
LALSLNHTLGDAVGLRLFINTWAEIARGANQPSILPVWRREILMARDPPHITCNHREYEQIILPSNTIKEEDTITTIHQSFFFTPAHIAAIRCLVPIHLRQCTTFDLIAACYWRCRTKALQLKPEEEARIMCVVNARSRFVANDPSLVGYYGNCIAFPAVVTTAGKLCGNPLGFAIELIRKAKAQVTEEYMHSVADLMVIKERCSFTDLRSCIVSDWTRAKFAEVDFGWGGPMYSGAAKGGLGYFSGGTFIVPHKNAKGEEGLILPICLPSEDMKRFAKELDELLGSQNHTISGPSFVTSTI